MTFLIWIVYSLSKFLKITFGLILLSVFGLILRSVLTLSCNLKIVPKPYKWYVQEAK